MQIESGMWQEFVATSRGDDGPLVIDCTQARWADPVAIAGVAASAQHAKVSGREVSFLPPADTDRQRYFSRMRLGKALDSLGVTNSLPVVNEHDQEGNLLELRTFSTESDGEDLARLVYDKLASMGGASAQVLEPLQAAISELAINTAYHADVEHGYAVAQTYPRKGAIVFCIADAGVGLKTSLERSGRLHPDDDSHALDMAVIRQLSGTEDPYRGYGLPDVVSSVRELGGKTEIASGTASTIFSTKRRNGDVDDVAYSSHLSSPYNGVIVQVTIPWMPGR